MTSPKRVLYFAENALSAQELFRIARKPAGVGNNQDVEIDAGAREHVRPLTSGVHVPTAVSDGPRDSGVAEV